MMLLLLLLLMMIADLVQYVVCPTASQSTEM